MSNKKLFISYSQEDLAFVKQLTNAIRSKGMDVWYQQELYLGSQGNDAHKAIKEADLFVVLISKNTVKSPFVAEEVDRALAQKKAIFTIRIDDSEIPEQLARIQVWDFNPKYHKPWEMQQLLSRLKHIVGDVIEVPVTVSAPLNKRSILTKGKGLFSGFSLGSLLGTFRGITGNVAGSRGGHSGKEEPDWDLVTKTEGESGGMEEGEGSDEMEAWGGSINEVENKTPAIKPKTGILVHSIPTKMQLQNTHRCIIRIGFDEVTIIKDFPERNREIVVKRDIRVSDVMEVEFLPNPHFEISALNNIKQPVDTYEHTEWNFDVMPKTVGEFPLTFKISIYLPNGSKEMILRESVSVITNTVPSAEVFIPSELMTLGEYYKTLNKKLKIITLFLASSSELADDRRAFEIFIGRKNKNLIKENVYLELIIWEDFLDAMSASRLQDEYNKAIIGCDVFISLFYTKVGKYTEEEFLRALEAFKLNKSPLIYTYFKDTDVKQTSLVNFQQRLSDMGHFYTRFKDTDDLNYQFGEQIVKFLPLIK